MTREKDDYFEIKFWKDWLYADRIKRATMVENLSFIKNIDRVSKLPKETKRKMLATSLSSLFEDLEQATYQKFAFEEKTNSNKDPVKKTI